MLLHVCDHVCIYIYTSHIYIYTYTHHIYIYNLVTSPSPMGSLGLAVEQPSNPNSIKSGLVNHAPGHIVKCAHWQSKLDVNPLEVPKGFDGHSDGTPTLEP